MFLRLLLLFTLVPLAELALLIQIGRATNLWFTIGLVLLTGLIGASLARRQGLETWRNIREQLARGEMPTGSLLEGLLILIAGVLLITPGVLTDCVGFSLLVPKVRERLKGRLLAWFKAHTAARFARFQSVAPGAASRDGTIIDVEYTVHPAERRELP